MTDLASVLCLAIAAVGIAYLLLSAGLVWLFTSRRAPAPAAPRSVTLLKPLHGAEPDLYENLASFCRQDYGAPVQIVLGIQSPTDPAIPVARRLVAEHPDLAIDLVIDARIHGHNRKVSNLINMARLIRHDLVVLSDSDMRVGPDYLARIAAELAGDGVGAVTFPYHGLPARGLWSVLAGLAIDAHFLPNVVVGRTLGIAEPCLGSTIALTRDTLERIGGFAVATDDLADDYAIGAAVRALGLAIALPSVSLGTVCGEASFGALLRQELRWTRTIREIDPLGHVGSAITHPLAFSLAALCLGGGGTALAFGAISVLCRLLICLTVELQFGLGRHRYWLLPARDLLSAGLFVASFAGRRVSWRGHRYDVAQGGVLITRPGSPRP